MSLPWFRVYADILDDEILGFLAFEDQRHFIWILAMKAAGLLDKSYPKLDMLDAIVGRKLGLRGEALANAKDRLIEVKLIDENWQPTNWDKRQFVGDHSNAERQRRYRERHRNATRNVTEDVTVTAPDTDTDTEINICATSLRDPDPYHPAFIEFWKAYPKRKSKGTAFKAWKKINPTPELRKKIFQALEKAKASPGWVVNHGEFIPYPATWLNANGWDDEYDEPAQRRRAAI